MQGWTYPQPPFLCFFMYDVIIRNMKHEIIIKTGRQKGFEDTIFQFRTDQDIPLEYFKERKSLDPNSPIKFTEGEVIVINNNGGMRPMTWKDFFLTREYFDELKGQNILSVEINGVDTNQEIIDEAEKVGATVKFPLLYHIQFEFDSIPEWVFNWYPTTGTLSKQKTTDKYHSMKSLGTHLTIKEALEACK